MRLDWTEEHITFLRQCIDARYSGRASVGRFFARFGVVVTRNALMGKAVRAGWRFNSNDEDGKGNPRPRRRRETIRRYVKPRERVARKRSRVSLAPEPLPIVTIDDHAIPLEQRRQLMELENHHCRFPIGDPGDVSFFFCASPEADVLAGHSYCPAHEWRATNHAGMARSRSAA